MHSILKYQDHFTKCLSNELNKCKKPVPPLFKVGHIFVFFNKEVNSQHLCFCVSNGLSVNRWEFKGMSFTQNGKEAFYQEVPFSSHWQWACVHDKSFPSTQGMFILTYTFFPPLSIIPSSPSPFGIACTCKMGWDEVPVREQCISQAE